MYNICYIVLERERVRLANKLNCSLSLAFKIAIKGCEQTNGTKPIKYFKKYMLTKVSFFFDLCWFDGEGGTSPFLHTPLPVYMNGKL